MTLIFRVLGKGEGGEFMRQVFLSYQLEFLLGLILEDTSFLHATRWGPKGRIN